MLHFPEIEASSHGEGGAGYVVCVISLTSLRTLWAELAVEDVHTGSELFQRFAIVPVSQQFGTRDIPATAVVPPFSQTGIGFVRSWEILRCIVGWNTP